MEFFLNPVLRFRARASAALLPLFFFAACGSQPQAPGEPAAQDAGAKPSNCTRELRLGSSIPVVTCDGAQAGNRQGIDGVKAQQAPGH